MTFLTERQRGILERRELTRVGSEEERARREFEKAEREAEKIRRREFERREEHPATISVPALPAQEFEFVPPEQEEIKKKGKRKKRKKKVSKLRVGRAVRSVVFAKPTGKPFTVGLRRQPSRRREEQTVTEIVTEAVHREPEIPNGTKTDRQIMDEFFS